MEFLFVSNYGFWKTHYTFTIKSDLKKPFQQLDVKLLNLDYGCQHMYMNMHLKLVEKVIWFINFYFLNSIFSAFLACLHTQIQNWQSSINNLPSQTISDWGPIFVQRWMLWYIVGIFLQNDNNCTEFYSNLFSPDT